MNFKIFTPFLWLLSIIFTNQISAQPWTYNFGTGTGSHTSSTASTSFLPTPTSGTARVRVGTNPGSITLANAGLAALGSGSELQITSNTSSTSTTKFSVYDYTASKLGYLKFSAAFSGGTNGIYQLSIGDGATFSDNTSMSTSQVFSGIRWSFGASNAITYNVLNSATYGTTGISNPTTLFTQSTSTIFAIEIYYNNTTTSQNYVRSGSSYSITSGTWDLWVDGTRVGSSLARGGISNDVNIDSWAFNHQSSSTSPGTVYLDDMEYSNSLPTLTNPTLTTPTATSITHNSATLGANVTSNGGASLSARGTAYKTTAGVTSSDNALAEGGTSTGTYSHSRTGLTEQTLYYYAGYATNSNGTGLSSESSFRTLSSPATVQASGLSATTASSTQIDLSFTGATFPGSGATQAGYVVIYSTGTPTLSSTNGQAPAAGVGSIFATSATNLPSAPSTSINVTSLASSTSYNFLVVPYTWDGTNAATYNYLTSSAPTASATTNAGTPSLNTPSVSTITENSATLGATVTSDGGSALTARGTVFKTSAGVSSSDNPLAEGGTSVSAFTHSRTSLSSQTLYYFAGYATNSGGTSLSSESSFRTLSAVPTAQATTLSTSNATTSTLDLSIGVAATFPGSGATQGGYVVIYSTGTPTLSSTNGQAPAAGVGTIFSTAATNLPSTPSTSITITGLAAGTLYNVLVVPYSWDGTNATTYNYLTASAPTTSGTTSIPTYTWSGANNASWATSTNWTPNRTTPGSTDILVFDGNSTLTVSGVPTETIGKLQITGSTTKITLQAASTGRVLTIGNSTGTDLTVDAGCELNINTTNTLSFVVATGATGSISGSMKFTQAAHTLIPADASAVVFNSGAAFIAGDLSTTGFSGNAFGPNSGTVYNGVVFASGSSFTQYEGSNPFAISQPNSRVQFQSGSSFIFAPASGSPSLSGRTYGNLEINTTNVSAINNTGSGVLTINGNLTVTAASGGFNFNLTGGITITGNISVASGQILGFSPASANTITLSGTTQNISGSGTLTIGSNTSFALSNSTTVNLQRDLTVTNNTTVATGATFNIASGGNLTINSNTINGAGAFSISSGGTLTTNNTSGIDGVITVSGSKTFSSGANFVFNGATTTPFGANFVTVTSNNLTTNANITLDKPVTVAGIFTLTSGVLTTSGTNLLTISNTSSSAVSRTAGYVSGPVAITLPANLSSGSTYLFPVGKSAYTPFELVNPTTNSGGTVSIKAEVFDASTGGSAGSGLASIGTTRYWDVSITSGGANFTNTTARITESSIGTYNRIANNTSTLAGTYASVSTAAPSGNSITTSTLTAFGYFVFGELAATVSEVYIPQYIQGVSGTNNNRIPYAFRLTISNLIPSSTYRYYNAAVITGDAASSNGAGNPIIVDANGNTFTRLTAPDLSSSYGSFTTDGSGNYTGWFVLEPTGDTRFDIANSVYMRIMLNNGNGGTAVSTRVTSTNTAKVIDLSTGSTSNDGTAIYGGTSSSAKNFALLFDNLDGTGRPINATFIESDAVANTAANGYATFYDANVNGASRKWGSIVPNVNANGVKRIEYRSLTDGSLEYWVSDNDGNWNGTANTVSPTGGSTALVISSSVSDSVTVSNNTTLQENMTINGKIDIASGKKLNLNGFTLTINNGFKSGSSGTVTGSSTSSIIITGSVADAGTLSMDQTTSGTTNVLNRLVVNKTSGTLSLGNALQIVDSVSVASGGTLASAGNLTLLSTASTTARVGQLNGGSITGNVNVQRFIPAITRRYRMLSPNTGNFTYSQLIDDIYVTGSGGAANGFDATTQNSTSVYTYQEDNGGTGRGWKALTNITNTLTAGKGALVFVRGDRTLSSPAWYDGPFPSQNAVTVDFVEGINSGNISPTVSYTNTDIDNNNGWNLVGNPYPSQIDWTLVTKSNLNTFFHILNPATGSYESDDGSGVYLASGQAFFVKAENTGSPTLTFTESCKVTSAPVDYFKSGLNRLTAKMIKDNLNSDVAWLEFKQGASNHYASGEDAPKFTNSLINFGFLVSPAEKVQLNRVAPLTNVADTFTLFANATQGSYTLQFSNMGMVPAHKAILLRDLFTTQITDLRATPQYAFNITNNTSSAGNRFELIFIDQAALPVELLYLRAYSLFNTNDVAVEWASVSEKNNAHYIIERSANNEVFEETGTVKGQLNSNKLNYYRFIDEDALTYAKTMGVQALYYRLVQYDLSGEKSYSDAVAVHVGERYSSGNPEINVFPNPANDRVTINATSGITIKYLSIYDITGKKVFEAEPNKTEAQIEVGYLPQGLYFIEMNKTYKVKLNIE